LGSALFEFFWKMKKGANLLGRYAPQIDAFVRAVFSSFIVSALFELCLQIGRYWYFPSQLLKTGGSFPRNYP